MKATARALLNDHWLPGERLESLSGQASYDAERNEIVLRLRAIGRQEPPVSTHRCRETWLGARKQVFWQEGIPFRPKRAEAQTATLLLRQFAHYAVEPRVTARDLQRELLTITRLAITAQGQRESLVECSAPLVGGEFRIFDAPANSR